MEDKMNYCLSVSMLYHLFIQSSYSKRW